jgi:hypothetical protein
VSSKRIPKDYFAIVQKEVEAQRVPILIGLVSYFTQAKL